jgi:pseudouridine synthase
MRLQKYLAEAGIASRRAAETLIRQGRVAVNGRVIKTLGTQLDPSAESVAVDGQPVRVRRKLYLALNKPPDVVCTRRDERDRRTVLDLLPAEWAKTVYPVGRLDRDTEGLLLLTNDGDFCYRVSHPRHEVPKLYVATVRGRAPEAVAASLVRGRVCNGEKLRARRARLVSANNSRSVLELELTEGKNREVRRLLQVLGLKVEHLLRVRIGPVRLGELPRGKWRTLTATEVRGLG